MEEAKKKSGGNKEPIHPKVYKLDKTQNGQNDVGQAIKAYKSVKA